MAKLAELTIDLRAPTHKLRGDLKKADSLARGLGERMTNLGRNMTFVFTATIGTAIVLAVKHLAKFDESMRNVNALVRDSEVVFQKASQRVRDLAKEFGRSEIDVARAEYQIVSATFLEAAERADVLTAAIRAGRAGLSTTTDASRLLTSTLNAYAMQASEVHDVSDVMFKTVERGQTTFSELTQHMQSVIASAAALGVPLGELGAALATLTKSGFDTARSTVSLNRALQAFLKPGKEMTQFIAEMGFESGETLIKTKGLAFALQLIEKEVGTNITKMAELFPNIRGLRAVMVLAGKGAKEFAEDLTFINNPASRAQATAKAFAEQSKSLGIQLDIAKQTARDLSITLGQDLEPIVRSLVGAFIDLMNVLNEVHPVIRKVAAAAGLLFVAFGPLLLIAGTVKTAYAFLSIATIQLAINQGWLARTLGLLNPKIKAALASTESYQKALKGLTVTGGEVTKITGGFLRNKDAMKTLGKAGDEVRDVFLATAKAAKAQGRTFTALTKDGDSFVAKMGKVPKGVEKLQEAMALRNVTSSGHTLFRLTTEEVKKLPPALHSVRDAFIAEGNAAERAGRQLVGFDKAGRAQTRAVSPGGGLGPVLRSSREANPQIKAMAGHLKQFDTEATKITAKTGAAMSKGLSTGLKAPIGFMRIFGRGLLRLIPYVSALLLVWDGFKAVGKSLLRNAKDIEALRAGIGYLKNAFGNFFKGVETGGGKFVSAGDRMKSAWIKTFRKISDVLFTVGQGIDLTIGILASTVANFSAHILKGLFDTFRLGDDVARNFNHRFELVGIFFIALGKLLASVGERIGQTFKKMGKGFKYTVSLVKHIAIETAKATKAGELISPGELLNRAQNAMSAAGLKIPDVTVDFSGVTDSFNEALNKGADEIKALDASNASIKKQLIAIGGTYGGFLTSIAEDTQRIMSRLSMDKGIRNLENGFKDSFAQIELLAKGTAERIAEKMHDEQFAPTDIVGNTQQQRVKDVKFNIKKEKEDRIRAIDDTLQRELQAANMQESGEKSSLNIRRHALEADAERTAKSKEDLAKRMLVIDKAYAANSDKLKNKFATKRQTLIAQSLVHTGKAEKKEAERTAKLNADIEHKKLALTQAIQEKITSTIADRKSIIDPMMEQYKAAAEKARAPNATEEDKNHAATLLANLNKMQNTLNKVRDGLGTFDELTEIGDLLGLDDLTGQLEKAAVAAEKAAKDIGRAERFKREEIEKSTTAFDTSASSFRDITAKIQDALLQSGEHLNSMDPLMNPRLNPFTQQGQKNLKAGVKSGKVDLTEFGGTIKGLAEAKISRTKEEFGFTKATTKALANIEKSSETTAKSTEEMAGKNTLGD